MSVLDIRGRLGEAILIGPAVPDSWFERIEGIARVDGVPSRVAVLRHSQSGYAEEDFVRGVERQGQFLAAFGGGAVPQLVDSFGRDGRLEGLVWVDRSFVSWPLFVETHRAQRGAIDVGLALTIMNAMADAFRAIYERQSDVLVTTDPDRDWHFSIDGRAVLECQPSPSWRHFSVGAAAAVLDQKFGWLAPEEVRGERLDERASVYKLAAGLFEMLAGTPAFAGPSSLETLRQMAQDEPPDVRTWRSDVPEPLAALLLECMTQKPDDRLRSIGALLRAIGTLRAEYPLRPNQTLGVTLHELFPAAVVRRRQQAAAIAALDFGEALARLTDTGTRTVALDPWLPPVTRVDPRGHPTTGVAPAPLRIDGALEIDTRCVTAAEYARFLIATGHVAPPSWPGRFPAPDQSDAPVVDVSNEDAVAYCAWVNGRLATNAEWTHAVRRFGTSMQSGLVWEWTADQHGEHGFVVRGGRYRNRLDEPADPKNESFEVGPAHDVGFRCIRFRSLS